MNKLMPLLFVATLLFSCKKDSDNSTPGSKYLVKVACTDCKIGISNFNENITADIKGSGTVPMDYVPGTITFSIWSNVDGDSGNVVFEGGSESYAGISLFSGAIKKSPQYDLISKQLPPKR